MDHIYNGFFLVTAHLTSIKKSKGTSKCVHVRTQTKTGIVKMHGINITCTRQVIFLHLRQFFFAKQENAQLCPDNTSLTLTCQ